MTPHAPTFKFSWSHSALGKYRQCPKLFYHMYVAKDAPKQPPSPHMQRGIDIHKAFELRLGRARQPIYVAGAPPETSARYEQYAQSIERFEGDMYTERQLGIYADMTPAQYDVRPWGRGIIDVTVASNVKATIVDFKTGKVYDVEGRHQAFTSALLTMAHHPTVQTVDTKWVYLDQAEKLGAGFIKKETFVRGSPEVNRLTQGLVKTLDAIQSDYVDQTWDAKPTALCAWCAMAGLCREGQSMVDKYKDRVK